MAYSHNHCIYSYTAYTNPLASGQHKRSLPSGVEVETLSKVPKNDATVQGESPVEITNKSLKFNNFGIKISVLENSLPEGVDTCVLHISFELSTDFETPANFELVSSIYRVKCEPKVQFKKPLTLEIQHCASLSSDHPQRLVFARATDRSKKFEILEGGHFPISKRHGSIQLTRFSWLGVFFCKVFGFPIEKMYSALLFRKNLPHHTIDVKCVVCQDLATHVQVIREELEKDRFTKEMDLDQIQFENAVEMELHSENSELWTVTRVTRTLSRDQIEGYSRVLDSNRRLGVIPAIYYRFNLKEIFVSESVNFLLMKTDVDEESHHLTLCISLPHTLGRSDSTTQRGECSGAAGQKIMPPVQTTHGQYSLKMTTDTPEYEAICEYRRDLTRKVSHICKDVAERLRDSGELTPNQCKDIIRDEDGAETLLKIIIDTINEPETALITFANFVTAIKNSGIKNVQTFVKDVIEAKRKKLYRELLTVPPGFQASREYNVFISYSRKTGTEKTVDRLFSLLEKKEGIIPFMDRKDLRPGDHWRSEINSAIKTCKVFVCVLTKRYMVRVHCNAELYEAEAHGKHIFPVVCEEGWGDVPGAVLVKEVVQDINYVSLVKEEDRETQLTDLVDNIKRKLQEEVV